MAKYNDKHGSSLGALKKIIAKIQAPIAAETEARKTADSDIGKNVEKVAERIKTLEAVGAEANVIESVKVNGITQEIDDKAVNISVPTDADIREKINSAINTFATKISENGAVDTFAELVNYVAEHGTEAGAMAKAIDDLEVLVGDKAVAVQIANAIEAALKIDGADKYASASGAVVGPDSAVRGNIPVFSNETGKVIGDSGVPIMLSNIIGGVAIGTNAHASSGGGAVGGWAKATSGGAVGNGAQATYGGAVGNGAYADGGGAVGGRAKATSGGAVGDQAEAGGGFSGGLSARVKNNGTSDAPNYIDAIQLGRGTNENPFTLQTYGYQVTDTTKTSSTDDGETWLKDVGRLSELDVDNKTSIVAAMNELKTLLLNARYQSFVRRPIFTTSPPEGNKYVELAEFSGNPSVDFPYGAMPITFTLVPYEFHSGGGTPRKSAEPVYVSIIPRYWNGSGQFPLTITYWGNSDYEIYLDATGATTDYEMPFRLVLPATNDNNNIRWSVYDCVNPYEHIDISFIDAKTEFAGSTKATVNEFFNGVTAVDGNMIRW